MDEKRKKPAESPGWGNRMLPLHHPLLDGGEWSVWQTGSECRTLIRSLTGGSWQLLQLTTECQTPCKNKVSLSKERMKPSWTRFLLRQPIPAPHFELCPSRAPIMFPTSLDWQLSVRRWQMTDWSWSPQWQMSDQEACCLRRHTSMHHTCAHRHRHTHSENRTNRTS